MKTKYNISFIKTKTENRTLHINLNIRKKINLRKINLHDIIESKKFNKSETEEIQNKVVLVSGAKDL